MTRLINIETATQVCSVSISRDHEILAIRESHEPNIHSRFLTTFIEEILQETQLHIADLDGITVSLGPGSYTGLRIGVSAAKGLAFGANLPIIGLNTLEILANAYLKTDYQANNHLPDGDLLLCPMIDARRMEVYTALYNIQLESIRPTEALIVDFDSFSRHLGKGPVVFFGNGSDKCRLLIDHPNAIFTDGIFPSSRFMTDLALSKFKKQDFVDTAYFEPFYLKDFIATLPKNKIFTIPPKPPKIQD